MTPKRTTPRRRRRTAPKPPGTAETDRRQNLPLREVLDELLLHVRWLSRNIPQLSPDEIEHAQLRLEWLADEIWRLAVEDAPERSAPR